MRTTNASKIYSFRALYFFQALLSKNFWNSSFAPPIEKNFENKNQSTKRMHNIIARFLFFFLAISKKNISKKIFNAHECAGSSRNSAGACAVHIVRKRRVFECEHAQHMHVNNTRHLTYDRTRNDFWSHFFCKIEGRSVPATKPVVSLIDYALANTFIIWRMREPGLTHHDFFRQLTIQLYYWALDEPIPGKHILVSFLG